MEDKIREIYGEVLGLKDDVDTLINLMKTLERLYEYESDREKRHIVKSVKIISEQTSQKIMEIGHFEDM